MSEATASTSGGSVERAVETNQRHLIKKILARYPSQWTFFRELVQNADDACAKSVIIDFETDKETKFVKRTIVSNDGKLFSQEDWARLTSIASGNPDVNKIGFFGVGFYCVFSLSDNPTVISGNKRLEFFWKGNALYTRESTQVQNDDWTRFVLPVESLENSAPPPEFTEIGGFLAELLSFTRFIRSVKVICDGQVQVTASREDEFSIPMLFPSSLTHEGDDSLVNMFNRGLGRTAPVRFLAKKNSASVSRTKLSMLRYYPDKHVEESSMTFLRAQATFHSQLSDHNARAYLDMTQKSHPPTVALSILASLDRRPAKRDQFKDSLFLYNKLSPIGGRGRVFVGFITSQSCGSVHIGGPFVPTMERENLDFATPVAKEWNLALFSTIGTLSRVLHETICQNPESFYIAKPEHKTAPKDILDGVKNKNDDSQSGGRFSFFGAIKKATSMFTAFAQDTGLAEVDEEQVDDDAVFSALEEKSGAIVAVSMAIFAPLFGDCRPYSGVALQIWRGFLAKDFEDGPRVWTSQGRAMSSDKCRLFPSPDADLPQLSSIETFPVVPMVLSRSRPVGFRNVGGLANSFIERLKEDGQILPFDLGDIVSELQKRPLRGLQETLAFVEWFFKPSHVQMVAVRCGNCGAQTKIRSTTTEFTCSACRFRLVFNQGGKAPGTSAGNDAVREQHLRQVLLSSVSCILDDSGAILKLAQWTYKLDSKLEAHLTFIRDHLPKNKFELICPYELTKRSAVDLDLEVLSAAKFASLFFSSLTIPLPIEGIEKCWRVLFLIFKHFANDREVISLLQSKPCIPTITQSMGLPKEVYTSELQDTHSEEVKVMASLPSFILEDAQTSKAFVKFLVRDLGCRESLSPAIIVNAFLKGNISRTELWRYIVDHIVEGKERLEPDVVQALAKSKCLGRIERVDGGKLKESTSAFLPSSLYAPSQQLIDLNDEEIPVVFTENEALVPFLQRTLGLRGAAPSRDLLLRIASSDTRSMTCRLRALSIAVQNEDQAFDFSVVNLPIVPCKGGAWTSPMGCYLEVPPYLSVFDPSLNVCALESIPMAKRLGVKPLPSVSRSVDYLERVSRDTKADTDFTPRIEPVIDHLATRQLSELNETDIARLSKMHIIPVPKTCVLRDRGVLFAEPRACFFETASQLPSATSVDDASDDDLRILFCFVGRSVTDKTPKHRQLYQALGVRDAPTLSELASQLANGAKETLARLGKDNYLNLLRSIASDFSKVKPHARAELSINPCFIGVSRQESSKHEEWSLFLASEICIEDDSRYRRLFPSVPSCPLEPSIEQMYLRCGSLPISDMVQETCSIRSESAIFTKEAAIMERRLCERIPVLIQKVPQDKLREDRVKMWTETAAQRRRMHFDPTKGQIVVLQVPTVHCELKLTIKKRIVTKTVTMSACVQNRTLFITHQIDFFHVASALVGEFSRQRSNDRALLWATLLQSTDQSLEEMGFVIHREPDPVVPQKPSRSLRDDDQASESSDDTDKEETPEKPVGDPARNPNKRQPVPSAVSSEPGKRLLEPEPPLGIEEARSLPESTKSIAGRQQPQPDSSTKQTSLATPPPRPPRVVLPTPSPSSVTSIISNFMGGSNGAQRTATAGGHELRGDPKKLRDSAIQTALDRCRSTDAPGGQIVSPATKTIMGEPMVDCTEHHELVQSDGIGSVECYVQKGSVSERPFMTNMDKARELSNLLLQLSIEVFGLDCSVIHLYWDERGSSRAFNRGGSLFFNLHSFVQDSDTIKSGNTWKRWFGTMAHELTHNLHAQHDAQFANFLELFCVEFADKFLYALKIRGLIQ